MWPGNAAMPMAFFRSKWYIFMMPYQYLSSLSPMGIRLGLDRVQRLLKRLGSPQEGYRTILIGGTNGKGSVAAMTAAILKSAGYFTGLYTSPHLVHVQERIRIDGECISRNEMASFIERVRKEVTEDITYFEFLTAVAFLYFSAKKVDVAVLEVGMGGRLDATNIVYPCVSAVTNISLEHQSYLGRTLEAIAEEKGAIISRGGTCITAARQRKVIDVLERICRQKRAALHRLGRDIHIRNHDGSSFSWYGPEEHVIGKIACALIGRHQQENAAVAIGLISAMRSNGINADETAIRSGLSHVRWEGRLEVVRECPEVLMDGAHNPAAVAALCRSLQSSFRYRRLIIIFGVLNDKNVHRMMDQLSPMADILILTDPSTDRARPADDYVNAVTDCRHVEICHHPRDALRRAYQMASAGDLICITGSLYLVGEMKKIIPLPPYCDNRSSKRQTAAE
ncbi:MAG: folylpolyglutamate synthase/dihydrofolate synthase family protein [Syntrophales bacterium]|jgi:dihydrofolate synthase/folylpolyglutamate synthase